MRSTVITLCAALALAGCTTLGKSREDAVPPLPRIDPLASVRIPWSRDAGGGIGRHWLVLAPTVEDGRVFVADARGRVFSHDAESGRSRWRTDTEAAVSGGVGAGAGLVLVGTEEGEVIALDAETGDAVWRAQVSSEVQSSPRVVGGAVVVRTLDGKLFGLDAGSGEQRWTYDGGVPSLSVRGTGSPAAASGVVFSGFDDGRLAAVRAASGEILWEARVSSARGRSEIERLTDVDTEPAVEEGTVYAASYDQAIAAFDAETGRELWRRDLASHSGLAADPDLLYAADRNGTVQALDRLSGATVWREDSLAGRDPAWPVVHGPFVAFADREGYVHWLRREDGRPAARTRRPVGDRLAGPPVLHGGALVVYGAGGRLSAFELEQLTP